MLQAEDLERPTCFCIHFVSSQEQIDLRTALGGKGMAVFDIDGPTISTESDLFSAFAKTLKFPPYFGMNWDALDDSLRDLSWFPAKGYTLFVRGSEDLWRRVPRLAGKLVEAWLFAVEEWRREGIPFHLVFVW